MKINPISPKTTINYNQSINRQNAGPNFSAKIPKRYQVSVIKKIQSNKINPEVKDKAIETLQKLAISNYRVVNSTSVSGATFSDRSIMDLVSLKEMGIDTIIDFRGEAMGEFAKACERAGFKYYNFNLNNVNNLTNPEYFIREENEPIKVTPAFVEKLKKFFEMVNEGNVYMGCQFGIDRTNIGLFLNYLMNSNVENAPTIITWPYERKKAVANKNIRIVRNIIKHLTPEQRKQLGIPEDYNCMLQIRIYEILDKNGLI